MAHQSQVFKLPPQVDDLNGVMVEPFSCALHSLLQNPLKSGDTVLVKGSDHFSLLSHAKINKSKVNLPQYMVLNLDGVKTKGSQQQFEVLPQHLRVFAPK